MKTVLAQTLTDSLGVLYIYNTMTAGLQYPSIVLAVWTIPLLSNTGEFCHCLGLNIFYLPFNPDSRPMRDLGEI